MAQLATRRPRRSIEQQIADLEAKVAAIRAREARKKAKADPALRHAGAALRSIDKALRAGPVANLRNALFEARLWLSQALEGENATSEVRARPPEVERNDLAALLLTYLRANPGQRAEQIAAALATDSRTLRPAMKRLIAMGKVRSEGQKRSTTYTPV